MKNGIYSFIEMYLSVKSNNKFCLVYVAYFLTTILYFFNPMYNTDVSVFKRVIGVGIIGNYDVSKVITHFYLMFLVALVVTCFIICAFNFSRTRYTEKIRQSIAWRVLDDIILAGVIANIFKSLSFFVNKTQDIITPAFIFIAWFAILILFYILFLYRYLSWGIFFLSVVGCFALVIPVASLLFHGCVLIKCICIHSIILIGLCFIIYKKARYLKQYINLKVLLGLLSVFPLLTSIFIETVNILASRNFIIIRPARAYIFFLFMFLIVILLLSYLFKTKNIKQQRLLGYFVFPSLLAGCSFFAKQLPLFIIPAVDLFESSNYSILISDLLNFGKLPIVEHYGGHMLRGVLEGVVYGIANHDIIGGSVVFWVLDSYTYNVLSILLLFFAIRMIAGNYLAFFSVLVVPIGWNWLYYAFSFFSYFTLLKFVKEKSVKSSILLWSVVVLSCAYRLDLGFAVLLSCIATFLYYYHVNGNYVFLKRYLFGLFTVFFFIGVLWIFVCIAKGIDIYSRLFEFISISSSNQNWSLVGLGNPSTFSFTLVYFLLPVFVLCSLVYIIVKFKKGFWPAKENSLVLLLLFLGIFYIVNFPRCVVRHTLQELFFPTLVCNSDFYLALLVVLLLKKRKLFLPFFFSAMILSGLLISASIYTEIALADKGYQEIRQIHSLWTDKSYFGKNNQKVTIWEKIVQDQEPVHRVQWEKSEILKKNVLPLQKIFSLLLNKNETFLDFINRSSAYSLLQRENPVYIVQSPAMLSGEFAQQQFVSEIQKQIDKVPIALLPAIENHLSGQLDGIRNNYRYYKVSEFIFQNYHPLCQIDEYAIWVVKDRYSEMSDKLERYFKDNGEPVKTAILPQIAAVKGHSSQLNYDNVTQTLKIYSIGQDPHVDNLQDFLLTDLFIGKDIIIKIACNSDVSGRLQLFYTTGDNEVYSEGKSLSANIEESSTVRFKLPVTKFSKLRLDIPEKSNVTIRSIEVSDAMRIQKIDYGYDGPIDVGGKVNYNDAHVYNLQDLPLLWAERDIKKAINNGVIAGLIDENGLFNIPSGANNDAKKGNYLLLHCTNINKDPIAGCLALGNHANGTFQEKCRYNYIVQPGTHSYLFRISSEYYWHIGKLNAVKIVDNANLTGISMKIVEGD